MALLTIASFVLALLTWAVVRDTTIPVWVFVPVVTVLVLALAIHADALRAAAKKLAFGSTRIKSAQAKHPEYPDGDCICVIESATPIPLNTMLSLYFVCKGFEYELGIGVVRRLQETGDAIMVVHKSKKTHQVLEEFLKRLQDGNADALTEIRINSSLTHPYLPQSKDEVTISITENSTSVVASSPQASAPQLSDSQPSALPSQIDPAIKKDK